MVTKLLSWTYLNLDVLKGHLCSVGIYKLFSFSIKYYIYYAYNQQAVTPFSSVSLDDQTIFFVCIILSVFYS